MKRTAITKRLPRLAPRRVRTRLTVLYAALFLLGVTLWALLRAGPPAHTGHPTRADTESDPAGSDTHR